MVSRFTWHPKKPFHHEFRRTRCTVSGAEHGGAGIYEAIRPSRGVPVRKARLGVGARKLSCLQRADLSTKRKRHWDGWEKHRRAAFEHIPHQSRTKLECWNRPILFYNWIEELHHSGTGSLSGNIPKLGFGSLYDGRGWTFLMCLFNGRSGPCPGIDRGFGRPQGLLADRFCSVGGWFLGRGNGWADPLFSH